MISTIGSVIFLIGALEKLSKSCGDMKVVISDIAGLVKKYF